MFKRLFLIIGVPIFQFLLSSILFELVIDQLLLKWSDERYLRGENKMQYLLLFVVIWFGYTFLYYTYLVLADWITTSGLRILMFLIFWTVPSIFFAGEFSGDLFAISIICNLCFNGIFYLPYLFLNLLIPAFRTFAKP